MASAANDLARLCVSKIESVGGWGMIVNSGAAFVSGRKITLAPAGTSDVIGHVCGVFVAIEVKIGNDVLKEDQLKFLLQTIDRLGVAIVARNTPAYAFAAIDALNGNANRRAMRVNIGRRHLIARLLDDYRGTRRRLPEWAARYEEEVNGQLPGLEGE